MHTQIDFNKTKAVNIISTSFRLTSTRPTSTDVDADTQLMVMEKKSSRLFHNFYHFMAVAIIFYGDDFELA